VSVLRGIELTSFKLILAVALLAVLTAVIFTAATRRLDRIER